MDEWIQTGVQYGLPTVLLLILISLTVRAAKWVGKEFIIPLRDQHFEVLGQLKANMEKQTELLGQQQTTLNRHTDRLDLILALQKRKET